MTCELTTCRLSPVQQGMYFHHLHAKNRVYLEQMVAAIDGALDPALVEETLQRIVRTHECLRTVFIDHPHDGQHQVVHPFEPQPLCFRDFSSLPDPDAAFARHAAEEMERNFDLRVETTRCKLIKLGAERHAFLWTYHHLIMDAWTVKLVQEQFCAIYLALLHGAGEVALPAAPYRRYVEWIERQDERRAAAYWTSYLDDHGCYAEPELPAADIDQHRITTVVACGARSRELLGALARQHRATRNQIVLAVWGTYVLEHFQRASALFGCVVSGRMIRLPDIDQIGGVFVNAIPIRVRASDSAATTIAQLRQHMVASAELAFMSLGEVMAYGKTSPAAITSVINFPFDLKALTSGPAAALPFRVHDIKHAEQAHYDLYLDAYIERELVLEIHHDPRTHEIDVAAVRGALDRILEQFAAHPDAVLGDARSGADDAALAARGALDFNRGEEHGISLERPVVPITRSSVGLEHEQLFPRRR